MELPSITFIKGQGGLGRPLPGQDFISSLLFYTAQLPSGFTATNRIKSLYALTDAVNNGILNDNSDATGAVFTYQITSSGAAVDSIEFVIKEPLPIIKDPTITTKLVSLGVYNKLASDSSIAILGASVAAAINNGTINHGYSASFATATLTITAPKKLGIYLNVAVTPVTVNTPGTVAGTLTQPSGGVASKLAVYYYHISEYFRIQPKGILFVGFMAIPNIYSFAEITQIQSFSNGVIRQMGILKDSSSPFTTSDLTLIDTVIKQNNDANYKPLSALYAADLSATTDISTLTDLSVLSANKATAVIAQDGGGQGNYLWQTNGKSITALGALLGTVSLSAVSQSIAWVAPFNISNGVECEVLAFANGQLFSSVSVTDGLLDNLNTKRYVFLKKFVGISGSWWNDSHTACPVTSDYAQIENNRTIDKAIRGIYTFLLPSLNAPILLNADGTITEITVAAFTIQAEAPLNKMIRDLDLSAQQVVINPNQQVLSTSKIIIAVALVINGVARNIVLNVGFKALIA